MDDGTRRILEILLVCWDASGELRARDAVAVEQEALTIEGMLASGARALEVQRYLRLAELALLGRSLHPASERHRIAELLFSAFHDVTGTSAH